jgi:hypothetical protein
MSVAEMKIEAINKITSLEDEAFLKEILTLLEKATEAKKTSYTLSGTYEEIKNKYEDVMQKLAR